jgi:protein-L-isoaspartate(D-aspartate) O-methyltransferase
MAALNAKRIDHDQHERDRAIMVARHLEARGVEDPLVLAAMGKVPREAFVSGPLTEFAYEDSALPIEAGQTISQPYIVARMIELAEIQPGDRVLEVGAGSGYAAAVLSRMAGKVYAIERHEELATQARARLKRQGYDNVEIIWGDGTKGLPGEAPFDAIIVSAGGPRVPEPLKQQLAIGGRLVIPVGRDIHQTLLLVRRLGEDEFEEEDHGGVTFVPLIGAEGWVEPSQAKEAKIDAQSSGFAEGLLIPAQRAKAIRTRVSHLIAEAAEPFGDLDELATLAERFADRRVVLLGEATHGTAEFYDARARITERLVAHHGFNIVAVEADWPDAAVADWPDAAVWNLRDQHMFDTLERLLVHRGPGAKAVVWAHNSHIGNAEFTEMGQVRGEHNIGQLARARFGEDVALIGFGTDRGTVAAASDWDGPMELKRVRTARDDSYEGRSREANIPAFFLETGPGQKDDIRAELAEPLLERAIGVIYRPETELLSHYFQAELSRQFDAWIWFTETKAVAAAPTAYAEGPDETYPFGL